MPTPEPHTEVQSETGLNEFSAAPHFLQRSSMWWWIAVTVYAAVLPFTIVVWERLVAWLGNDRAASVPWIIIGVVAACVAIYALNRPEPARWYLIAAAAVLAALLAALPEYPAKRIHLPSYMLMAVLVHKALFERGALASVVRGIWVVVICTLIGVADEIVQGFLPNRFFALADALSNAGAALVGVLLLFGLRCTSMAEDAETRKITAVVPAIPGLLALGGVLIMVQSDLSQTGDGPSSLSSPFISLAFLVASLVAIAAARVRASAATIATAIVSAAALGLFTIGALMRVPFQ